MKLKKSSLKILAVVLLVILSLGMVFGSANKVFANKDGKIEITPIYTNGAITTGSGLVTEADANIITRKMFECKGLEIEVKENTVVKYQVFFYDKDEKFLSFNTYTSSQKFELANDECYARIEIFADTGDEKIELFDYYKYANRLTILIDADQDKE